MTDKLLATFWLLLMAGFMGIVAWFVNEPAPVDHPRALRGNGDVRLRVVEPEKGFVASWEGGQSGATEWFDAHR